MDNPREGHEKLARVLQQRLGRALGTHRMLEAGDRVLVALSGGKDSFTLLQTLQAFRSRSPVPFEILAGTVEQSRHASPHPDFSALMQASGIPWFQDGDELMQRRLERGEQPTCDACSRLRRRVLYRLADRTGCNVIALGHTADDCAEALLRNICFNGRIASLPPVARSSGGGLRIIRPFIHVLETMTADWARMAGLPPQNCRCPSRTEVRDRLREFLRELAAAHPDVPDCVNAALGNINLFTLFDTRHRPAE